MVFLTTQLCAIYPIIFLMSKWQHPRHIGTKNIKNIKYSSVSLFAKYLIALGRFESQTNSRQDISKEKYEMTMHFCVCSMQIHIWIAVQKYLFAYFLVIVKIIVLKTFLNLFTISKIIHFCIIIRRKPVH